MLVVVEEELVVGHYDARRGPLHRRVEAELIGNLEDGHMDCLYSFQVADLIWREKD